jgi:hypothetical protein
MRTLKDPFIVFLLFIVLVSSETVLINHTKFLLLLYPSIDLILIYIFFIASLVLLSYSLNPIIVLILSLLNYTIYSLFTGIYFTTLFTVIIIPFLLLITIHNTINILREIISSEKEVIKQKTIETLKRQPLMKEEKRVPIISRTVTTTPSIEQKSNNVLINENPSKDLSRETYEETRETIIENKEQEENEEFIIPDLPDISSDKQVEGIKAKILKIIEKYRFNNVLREKLNSEVNENVIEDFEIAMGDAVKRNDDKFYVHHIFFGGTGSGKTYLMKQMLPIFLNYMNNVLLLDAKGMEFIQLLFPLKYSVSSYEEIQWMEKYIEPESLKKWYEEGLKGVKTKTGKEIVPIVYLTDYDNSGKIKIAANKLNVGKLFFIKDSLFNLLEYSVKLPRDLDDYLEGNYDSGIDILIDEKKLKEIDDEKKMNILRKIFPDIINLFKKRKKSTQSQDIEFILKFILKMITIDFYFLSRKDESSLSKLTFELYEKLFLENKVFLKDNYETVIEKYIDDNIKPLLKDKVNNIDIVIERMKRLFIILASELNNSYNLINDIVELPDDIKEKMRKVYLENIETKDYFSKLKIEWNKNNDKVFLIFVYAPERNTPPALKTILAQNPPSKTILVLDELLNAMRVRGNDKKDAEALNTILASGLNTWRSKQVCIITLYQDISSTKSFEGLNMNINDIIKAFKNRYFFSVSGKAGMESYLGITKEDLADLSVIQNKVKSELKKEGFYINLWFSMIEYGSSNRMLLYNPQYKVPHLKPGEFENILEKI